MLGSIDGKLVGRFDNVIDGLLLGIDEVISDGDEEFMFDGTSVMRIDGLLDGYPEWNEDG